MAADMFALLLCFTVFMLVPVSNISAKAFSDFFFYYISFLNCEFLIPVFKFCPLEKFKLETYWLAAPVPGGGTSCLPKGALPTRAGSCLGAKRVPGAVAQITLAGCRQVSLGWVWVAEEACNASWLVTRATVQGSRSFSPFLETSKIAGRGLLLEALTESICT